MSGPVAKSLRGKKKKKDGGNLPAGNERKIEQVGKLSLPRVARPSSSVIEHAAVRFAKMSLRLQTNDRLDPCGSNALCWPFYSSRESREKYPCGKTAGSVDCTAKLTLDSHAACFPTNRVGRRLLKVLGPRGQTGKEYVFLRLVDKVAERYSRKTEAEHASWQSSKEIAKRNLLRIAIQRSIILPERNQEWLRESSYISGSRSNPLRTYLTSY
ncbi:uncharacterized protein LOC114577396 [Apis cerana]|uniref:uncharacterized protein LOC114577396 n=1 Tax=Apis cerana TaxID=7461 RepID=UPI002B23B71B|nr:uncharacterized protein LOC114577396 [Apis cerana]